ncbi:hypothetical protein CEXT_148241 [Caerostris extrusa]|uniref:Uncharacterized protein n=1 Tax=Caerostris extrusa TaxID=172846 RepID=A0AAV4S8P8_CAEEX|nr:hypothetical protein CEXT_148241 [Caerostris extrusa]
MLQSQPSLDCLILNPALIKVPVLSQCYASRHPNLRFHNSCILKHPLNGLLITFSSSNVCSMEHAVPLGRSFWGQFRKTYGSENVTCCAAVHASTQLLISRPDIHDFLGSDLLTFPSPTVQ